MEKENVIQEMEHKDCFFGYLGAFIGGLIAAFPWLLIYYYFSANVPLAALLIPIGCAKEYKFFKGIVNEHTSRNIVIMAIVVFCLTIFAIFPYLIENLTDENAKQTFEEDIIETMDSSIVFFIIGTVIAIKEINVMLKRYSSTNGMIKDTNAFIREDNSPIGESGTGIKIFEKDDKAPNLLANVDKWDEKENNINNLMNRRGRQCLIKSPFLTKVQLTSIKVSFVVFIVIPIIIIVSLIVYSFSEFNKLVQNYDDNYDYSSSYYNSYNDSKYTNAIYTDYEFEKYGLKCKYPSSWGVYKEYDNAVRFYDDIGLKAININTTNNNLGEYDYYHELLEQLTQIYGIDNTDIYSYTTYSNGATGYYSTHFMHDLNLQLSISTMKLNDYYVFLIDFSEMYEDNSRAYNEILSSFETN